MGTSKIVSEYDQEIPQSQTADKPMTSRGRATQVCLFLQQIYNVWQHFSFMVGLK